MRLHQIDLNLLVVFEAVYREQNLTRAAQRLGLTQPAISHTLSRLRELFGDPLFTRNGRVMEPTPAARNLIGPVRQALSTLEHGLFPQTEFEPARSDRRFHVAVREAFELMWLPPMVKTMQSVAPRVQLVSVRLSQPTQLEADLASGNLDLALDLSWPVSAAVHSRELGHASDLVVIGRRGHPAFKGKLTLERYLAAAHILVSSRRRGPGLEDLALRSLGHRRHIALRCQSHIAACETVRQTDLLLTLSRRVLVALTGNTPLSTAPIPFSAPPIGVRMYWHSTMDNDPANAWLRETILALATDAV